MFFTSSIIVTKEKQAFPPSTLFLCRCFFLLKENVVLWQDLGSGIDVKNKIKNVEKKYFLLPSFLKYLYYPKHILVFFMGPGRTWGERL